MYAPAGRPGLALGRRLLSVVAVAVLLSALGLAIARATVGAVSLTARDAVAGTAGADYRIGFTSDANVDATGIHVTFPDGYAVAAPGVAGVASSGCAGPAPRTICVNGTRIGVTGATASGQTITITLAPTDLTPGTVEFDITAGVTNPQTAGTLAASGFTVATTSATTNAEAPMAAAADLTIVAAAPARVAVTGPATVTAGTSSSPFTLTVQDQYGNPSNVVTSTVFGLSSDSSADTFRDADDAVDVTQLTVASGTSSAQFRYRDTITGSPTITVSRVSGDALATAASDTAGITVQAALDPDPDPDPAPDPAPDPDPNPDPDPDPDPVLPDPDPDRPATPAPPEPVTEETTTEEVEAGETVTTDPDGAGATRDDPVHAAVTTPNAGTVIIRRQVSWPSPAGFELVADQLDISAPAGTPESPLVLRLTVDGSAMADATFVVAFRERALVRPCAVEGRTTANPDPCLSERTTVGDDTVLTLLTSRGGVWNVGVLPRGSIALVCPYATSGSGFRDVTTVAVHGAAIDCVVGQDIARGTAADHYSPGGVVTRAQMATFVARLLDAAGVRLPADTSPAFSAIEGKLHGSNIGRLAAAGIVSGRTATSYDPAGPVTREQLATFLVRAFEYATGREVAEADATFDDIGGTHASNVRRLIGLGITVGVTDTSYAPTEGVRRGQMASFLSRVLNRLAAESMGTSGLRQGAG